MARIRVEALRRYNVLVPNSKITLEEVEKDLKQRDQNDSTRDLAPLKPAEDAVRIDSTDMSIQEVVDQMIACIEEKSGEK